MIPLEVTNDRIYLNVTLLIQRIGLKPLRFIIDTGSPKTFIGLTDAIKLDLYNHIKDYDKCEPIFMGITSLQLGYITGVTINLKNSDMKLEKISIPKFNVIKSPMIVNPNQQAIQPNIIGLDFMRLTGLSLHYIPKENRAFFD